MDGLGVVQVAQQLAAAGAVDVAPVQGGIGIHRSGAPTAGGLFPRRSGPGGRAPQVPGPTGPGSAFPPPSPARPGPGTSAAPRPGRPWWGSPPGTAPGGPWVSQGQSWSRSRTLFSERLSRTGSRCGGTLSSSFRSSRMSAGTASRRAGPASGSSPPEEGTYSSNSWRSRDTGLAGVRQMRDRPAAAWAASLSRARKPSRGRLSSIRPTWRSRTSSGAKQQHGVGTGLLGQPPQPLGEGGAVGGVAHAHHRQGAAAGQRNASVQGTGPVPLQPERPFRLGKGGGNAVDNGQGVQPFQQDPLPAGGNGAEGQRFLQGDSLQLGQPLQPGRGQAVAAGGRVQLRTRVGWPGPFPAP